MQQDSNGLVFVSLTSLISRRLSKDKKPLYENDGYFASDIDGKRIDLWLINPVTWETSLVPAKHWFQDDGSFVDCALYKSDNNQQYNIALAITPLSKSIPCRIMAARLDDMTNWHQVIQFDQREVNFIRSIHAGQIGDSQEDAFVVGTRPNGGLYWISQNGDVEKIESERYGRETTNVREVCIADFDNDGVREIGATIAKSDPAYQWDSIPGSLVVYKGTSNQWQSKIIDDFSGETHSRMLYVGDAKNTGSNNVLTVSVGIHDPKLDKITQSSSLYIYTYSEGEYKKELIDTFEEAIKARSIAIGDIDRDGINEIVVGSRNPNSKGNTYLYAYKWNETGGVWERQQIDKSGELGFHCVEIIQSEDGNYILASDDGKGQIKRYWKEETWRQAVVIDLDHGIFVTTMQQVAN